MLAGLRKRCRCLIAVTAISSLVCLTVGQQPAQAFTNETLMYGSRGYNVDELQSRLGYLGFYHDKVDGDFGWDTYWAVRDFQYRFIGRPTGVVDLKTRQKLVAATSGWHYTGPLSSSTGNDGGTVQSSGDIGRNLSGDPLPNTASGLSQQDLSLLAHVVYAEARGEPFIGQVAVAAVLLNRMHSSKFPHSLPAIVYQPGAFTSVQDGQINLAPNATAQEAAVDAMHGWDPSHGALYYFNPATSTSTWVWSKPEITKIGHHIFAS